MNKKEFISKVTETLRENDIRKPVSVKKHTFHITDDEGNVADFNIKQANKNVIYTTSDVEAVIESCMAVIVDAIKRGETISIYGFGSLGVRYRAARRTKDPYSGEWCEVDARHVPKFYYGNSLRDAALMYDLSLSEMDEEDIPYRFSGDEEDSEDMDADHPGQYWDRR